MLLISFFLILLISRINSSILGYEFLNTDEFVIGAKAKRIVENNFNVYEFDGDTSGILNALFLTWPEFLNLDITYLSIRLSGIFSLSIVLLLTYKIINLYVDKKEKWLLFLPLILFFALTKDADFLHYSNELITTILILLSLYVFLKNYQKLTQLRLFLIGLISGSILFSKMQFYPLAGLLIFFIIINLFLKERNFRFIFVTIFGFLFPLILFSTYYLYHGEIVDLYFNVIHYPLSDLLVRNSTSSEVIVSKNDISTILQSGKRNIFFTHLLLNSAFHFFYFYLIFLILTLFKVKLDKKKFSPKNFPLILTGLLIIVSFVLILITGSVHRHYLIVLMPLIPIFLAIIIKKTNLKINKKNTLYNQLLCVMSIFVISLVFEKYKFYSKNFKHNDFNKNQVQFHSPKILQHLKIDNKKMIVWGWKPELYLLSSFHPATRDAINQKQIDFKSNRNYFRNRFLEDFDKNQPSLIINYVKPKGYFFNKEDVSGIEKFKELKKKIDFNYKKINTGNKNCPDYYLRKKEFNILNANMIKYNIEYDLGVNTNYIKDLNIDENMCKTGIIFSKDNKDYLTLNFDNKKLNEIKILSTKRNIKKTLVFLNFYYENQLILQEKLNLNKYPHWSVLKIKKNFSVDQIKINVSKLKSNNFGINEVVIF